MCVTQLAAQRAKQLNDLLTAAEQLPERLLGVVVGRQLQRLGKFPVENR
ncbi:hypothetical protein X738_29945 [Mesorhizobium sp. LNHC209A00]|nr:hypothetical protein X738_29945 [Mesorhizobium sp. LNHC209A00]